MPDPSAPVSLQLAVPTALHDDGHLDTDGQAAVAAAAAAAGADTVHVLGLTDGEVGLLTDDERAAVVTAARRGAGGLAVAAGAGPPGPEQLRTARRLADAGADLLTVAIGGPPARRAEAVGEVAALGVPILVHHHPAATGTALATAEVAAVAVEVDAVGVLAEQVPVPDVVTALVDGGVRVLGGLGALFLPEELESGAGGTAAATAAVEDVAEVVRRYRAGDTGAGREHHLVATGYLRLEAGSAGTTVRKEAWRQRGYLRSGRVRGGTPLGRATKQAVTRRLRELGVELADPYPDA